MMHMHAAFASELVAILPTKHSLNGHERYLYAPELYKVCIKRVGCPCWHNCLVPCAAQLPILVDQERHLVLSLPQHLSGHTAWPQ